MPVSFGILGPVMSASSMPTLRPLFASWRAISTDTLDLPTPPLPLITAMVFLMLLNWFSDSKLQPPSLSVLQLPCDGQLSQFDIILLHAAYATDYLQQFQLRLRVYFILIFPPEAGK
jgi:hypothetical protein